MASIVDECRVLLVTADRPPHVERHLAASRREAAARSLVSSGAGQTFNKQSSYASGLPIIYGKILSL